MNNIKFYFGIENNYDDITELVYAKCIINNEIYISTNKTSLFDDKHPYIVKKLKINLNNDIYIYDEYDTILIKSVINYIIYKINNIRRKK